MAAVRTVWTCLSSVFLLNVLFGLVSSVYFHVGDAEERCFLKELPEGTDLIGSFRTQLDDRLSDEDPPPPQDLGMLVVAKDPDEELVLSRRFGSEGTFHFTSMKPGEFKICLQSTSSQRPLSAGGMLTVHLDFREGERTNNYTEIAATEHLSMLRLRVRQLSQQVLQIQRQLEYQRVREKDFREISHSTSMWIFWWPVARSLYVVAIITWFTKSW